MSSFRYDRTVTGKKVLAKLKCWISNTRGDKIGADDICWLVTSVQDIHCHMVKPFAIAPTIRSTSKANLVVVNIDLCCQLCD